MPTKPEFPYYFSKDDIEDMQDVAAQSRYRAQDTNFNRLQLKIGVDADNLFVFTALVSFLFPKEIYHTKRALLRHVLLQATLKKLTMPVPKKMAAPILKAEEKARQGIENSFSDGLVSKQTVFLNNTKTLFPVELKKLKYISEFKHRLKDLNAHICSVYDKRFPDVTFALSNLLKYHKDKKIKKGVVEEVPLVDEAYYLHIVLSLCNSIKSGFKPKLTVFGLQEFIVQLLQEEWPKIIPADRLYHSADRKNHISADIFNNFLNELIPKAKTSNLNFLPLLGENATKLLDQLLNIYLFTVAHDVRVNLRYREPRVLIDTEIELLKNKLFDVVDKLLADAFTVNKPSKSEELLMCAHEIDNSLQFLLVAFMATKQNNEDVDELLKCFRFTYRYLDSSVDEKVASQLEFA